MPGALTGLGNSNGESLNEDPLVGLLSPREPLPTSPPEMLYIQSIRSPHRNGAPLSDQKLRNRPDIALRPPVGGPVPVHQMEYPHCRTSAILDLVNAPLTERPIPHRNHTPSLSSPPTSRDTQIGTPFAPSFSPLGPWACGPNKRRPGQTDYLVGPPGR